MLKMLTYNFNSFIINDKTLFITYTNEGYITYTENLLLSLKNVNLDQKILIFCLDEESNSYFSKKYQTYYFEPPEVRKEFMVYDTDKFKLFMWYKYLIIYKLLQRNYNVIYTDGDIVFMKNCIPDLIERIKDCDMVMQMERKYDNGEFCSGFFMVKSNEKTIKHFDVETNNFYKMGLCDQVYFNTYIKTHLNVKPLPLELYVNGDHFLYNEKGISQEHIKNTSYLIHFNFLIGHDKMKIMKHFGLWYIKDIVNSENSCQFVCSRGLLKSCNHFNQNIYSSCQESTINPVSVKPGDKVYVCNYAINHFAFVILPKIQVPFILVSGDSDNEIPNSTMQASQLILTSPKVLHWFCQNFTSANSLINHPKITALPIGLDYHFMTQNNSVWGQVKSALEQEKEILNLIKLHHKPLSERLPKIYSTFHFALERGDRREAYSQIPKHLIDYEPTQISRLETHTKQMDYVFIASPYGGGPDCHRTWEALILGCIPIIKRGKIDSLFENDEYKLPILLVNKWSDINEELLKNTIEKYKNQEPFHQLPQLQLKYWTDKFEKISQLVK